MNNFEVEDKLTGNKYWISRSIAVLAIVEVSDNPNGSKYRIMENENDLRENEMLYSETKSISTDSDTGMSVSYMAENLNYVHKTYILVNKRGSGTPNYQGCWNIPCGYLDFDERLADCATREVMEECNVFIPSNNWSVLLPIDDYYTVGDTKQNVTIRFETNLTMEEYKEAVARGKVYKDQYCGEDNEVDDVELMELTKENIDSKTWAFNHKALLERLLEMTESYVY